MSTDAKKPYAQFHRTDVGNAEMFAATCGKFLRYDHAQSRWLSWNGRRWKECDQKQPIQMLKNVLKTRLKAAVSLESDDTERAAEIKHILESENKTRIEAALSLAQSEPQISDSGRGWDSNPLQLGVANGVLDLSGERGEFRSLTQDDRITKFSPVRFDPDAKCPRWLKFLYEVFEGNEELIRFVQKAIGYSLSGDVSEHVLFILYGSGRNGKSTFVETILELLGDHATPIAFSVLSEGRRMIGEGVNLYGARFVSSVETKKHTRLDEARVKSWTGGDTITVRPLYRNAFAFKPSHKLWLAVNHLPKIEDESVAMWERLRLIPFTHYFAPSERDKRLRETLRAELPGILLWAVQGYFRWKDEGLEPPETVTRATRAYEKDSDPIARFLAARCELGPELTVTSADLKSALKEWADECEQQPQFSGLVERLKTLGCTARALGHSNVRGWKGLRLLPVTDDASTRADASSTLHKLSHTRVNQKVYENQCSQVLAARSPGIESFFESAPRLPEPSEPTP